MLLLLGASLAIFAAVPDARRALPWVALCSDAILMLFSTLTVTVTDQWLRCQFGPGLIRHRIQLSEVQRVEPVRNAWWYGWGIRLTPHGWLWNVSGLDAVELTYLNGKKFRVGTDQPARLVEAIQAHCMRNPRLRP